MERSTKNPNASLNGSLKMREHTLSDILRSRYTNCGYKQLTDEEGLTYASYLVEKRKTKDTLFVGANDGMLHALDANNEILPKISTISSPKYGCYESDYLPHKYLVDGKSSAIDAYFNNQWRSILLGRLGLEGKAIYALDVTKPEKFSTQNVLWEVSYTQSPDNQDVLQIIWV